MEVFVVTAKPYPYELPWGDDGEVRVLKVFKSYLQATKYTEEVYNEYYSVDVVCRELE